MDQQDEEDMTSEHDFSLEDLYTVEGLAAQFPKLISVSTLRWQLRSRHQNGLDSSCVRIGKKLLINKPRYEAWLKSRAGTTNAPIHAEDISTVSGVYFLIDSNGEVVYVGQSVNVHARIEDHRRDPAKEWASAKFIPCKREHLSAMEKEYITKFQPKYNKTMMSTYAEGRLHG
ncbi:MAG: GIY-YIG nuclease family protein [Thauera sp.]|nr:GIY-YIG nuclease family protein [Thauera sp.]